MVASRNETIVHKMEALALTMLARVDGKGHDKVNLDVQMDVFDRVGKWIAIKNKLENDDGGGIADYKRRLHEQSAPDKHKAAGRSGASRANQPNGGSGLDAIKSRIPRTDDGGADGDSGGSGGENTAVA